MTEPRTQLWRRRWSRHGPPLPLSEAMGAGAALADDEDCEVLVVALGVDPNVTETASERVKRGMERGRAAGKHVGRPRKVVDVNRAAEMVLAGVSLKETARVTGIDRNTLRRRMREIGVIEEVA